jgi:hypothetical protein
MIMENGIWRALSAAWISPSIFGERYALNVEKLPFGSETPPGKMAKQIEAHSIGVATLAVRLGR